MSGLQTIIESTWMESRMTVGGEVRGTGTEQKGKRAHGHGQRCGDCWGEGV